MNEYFYLSNGIQYSFQSDTNDVAPNGDRCAAGCLIPIEEYTQDMENSTVFFGAVSCFFQRHYPVHCQMIFDLQSIHDSYAPHTWEQKWFEYAQEHALIMPEYNSVANLYIYATINQRQN